MDNTVIDIIKSYIRSMEDIESKFISKELDDIIDENLYIRTLEKHNMLLGILNKYHEECDSKKKDFENFISRIDITWDR
ncbi:hypothetical protein [Clostridium sp.]|uniref:hypothetical protein n=1 Tax=Clostridium sp. TaxID=1506 RepID=UPI001DB6A61F|nr:hypothetical protein [Clostridium sp.]MBS5308854.1 hypothetical protein [Clostridium sp.]